MATVAALLIFSKFHPERFVGLCRTYVPKRNVGLIHLEVFEEKILIEIVDDAGRHTTTIAYGLLAGKLKSITIKVRVFDFVFNEYLSSFLELRVSYRALGPIFTKVFSGFSSNLAWSSP